jgi:hypothetical protein
VVLWHHSGGVYAFWARRDRREASVERVASGRNFIISLWMPSGPGFYGCSMGELGVRAEWRG